MSNRALWVLGSVLFGLAVPAQAQQGATEDPTLKKTGDSVTEPFDGKEVPEKLLAIQDDPYSLAGLRKCAAIIREEIGRASCRERVCQYVWISVVAVSLKKKKPTNNIVIHEFILHTHTHYSIYSNI